MQKRGVTIVELLTVLALMAILGGMLALMFGSMNKSYQNMNVSLDVYEHARSALARMAKELAPALFDASTTPPLGLKGSASDISFHTVIRADALTADNTSSDIVAVRFALATDRPDTLTRYLENSNATSFPALPVGSGARSDLADGITAFNLAYFATASDFEQGIAQISWDSGPSGKLPELIRVKLTVKDRKGAAPPRDFESVVNLRNAA